MYGRNMRATQAHRCCRCLVEVDSTVEGAVQEGERASQRAGLEVELARDAGSLHAHTPDRYRSGLAISDEQIRNDLGPYASLWSPLSPFLRGIESRIAHPQIDQSPSRRRL